MLQQRLVLSASKLSQWAGSPVELNLPDDENFDDNYFIMKKLLFFSFYLVTIFNGLHVIVMRGRT